MNALQTTIGDNILHELVGMLTEAETAAVIDALRKFVNSGNPEQRIQRLAELQEVIASDLGVLAEQEDDVL